MYDKSLKVYGLFINKWPESFGQSLSQYYKRAVYFKANPRDEEYMKSIFEERFPTGEFIDCLADVEWTKVKKADMVVLLYPDAIGLGFCNIERKLNRNINRRNTSIYILNGRRRFYEFNFKTRICLYCRRVLERYMIGEILVSCFIVVLTPLLWLWDQLRGRR